MKISLRIKAMILIIFFAVLLSGVALSISSRMISNMIEDNFRAYADHLSATVALSLDGDMVERLENVVMGIYREMPANERVGSDQWGSAGFVHYTLYYSSVCENPDYLALEAEMKQLQDVNDVDCIYLLSLDELTNAAIYLADAAETNDCPVGCFDPIFDFNRKVFEDPERGFPAYSSTTDEYGWLITAAAPVHNSKGKVVAYAAVDVKMDEIRSRQMHDAYMLAFVMLALTIIICIAAFLLTELFVVRPIRRIAQKASEYCEDEKGESRGFSSLRIETGDEIEELLSSMKKMEHDLNEYHTGLLAAQKQVTETKEEADRLSRLSRKDELTGVRNRRSYEQDAIRLDEGIGKETEHFGIAVTDLNNLKRINDKYGHEMGDMAICKLCSIVCNVFRHSPVYRYSEDEFIVILEKRDYEYIEELEKDFNAKIQSHILNEALKPWHRVSAAFGYARFERKKDTNVRDVFERAENNMQEHKRRMKKAAEEMVDDFE